MADAPAAKRVAVITGDGKFGTVEEQEAHIILEGGGRLLSAKEQADRAVQERYDAKPLAEKVVGHAKTAALATPLAPVVAAGIGDEALPEVAAFGAGTRQGLTAGLAEGATRQAIDAVGTRAQGEAYAAKVQQEREASPIARALGGLYGMGIGTALGAATPAGAISAAGNVAEQATARVLSGVAARGVMGRALATGGELAVRGGVEGALMAAGDATGDAMLGDHELAADKVFAAAGMGALTGAAGGGLLGFGGSLAKSGVQAAMPAVGKSLERVLAQEGGSAGASIKGMAEDRAWRTLNAGKAITKEANARLAGGSKAGGEVMLRRGVLNTEDGVIKAGMEGTPDALLPKIAAEREIVGSRIGELTQASGATVKTTDIDDVVARTVDRYSKIAGREAEVGHANTYGDALRAKLGLAGEGAKTEATIQDLLVQRKGLDDIIYEESKSLNASGRVGVLRDLRSELESLISTKLDDASGLMKGELAAEYKALKHDYHALSLAERGATNGMNAGASNRTYSLTDKIIGSAMGAAGLAIGGPVGGLLGGPGAATVSKFVRERGDAALAVALSKASDMGAIQGLVAKVDGLMTRAAKGVLQSPKALPAGTPKVPVGERARATAEHVAKIQADPERFVEEVTRRTEGMAQHAPMLAGAFTKRATDAAAFLASKMPPQPPPDPFDPRPRPKMTPTQAMEFARYADYVQRPARFFEEAERGQITFEGVETAKALMPRAFAEMQMRVAEGLADMLARNLTVPIRQRERLGLLMDFPAVPSQRPEHALFLQSNVLGSDKANQPTPPQGAGKPTSIKSPSSALDRLEERGAGRR